MQLIDVMVVMQMIFSFGLFLGICFIAAKLHMSDMVLKSILSKKNLVNKMPAMINPDGTPVVPMPGTKLPTEKPNYLG